MYKSQLQELAQKRGWKVPQYESRKEGPSHRPQFQAWVNGTRYASEAPFFGNLKAAEQSAAKVALQALTGTTFPAESAPIGLTKNSLQEYTQKNGLPLPIYTVESSGELHSLDYTAVVEVGGVFYRGAAAKTKKEAEVKAARTAMLAMGTPDDEYIPLQTKKRVRATNSTEPEPEPEPQRKLAKKAPRLNNRVNLFRRRPTGGSIFHAKNKV